MTINDGVVFKIVDNLIQSEGVLRLFSLNSLYKPFDVRIYDIKEVGRFVNFISTEMPEINEGQDALNQKLGTLTREIEEIKQRMDRYKIKQL